MLLCAFNKLREQGFYKHTTHCTIKHLNILIEQDHRHIKRRFSKSTGFQSLRYASRILKGIETIRAIYKQNRSSSTIISYFLDIVPHLPTCLCFFKLCNRAGKSKGWKEVEQYLVYHFNMKVNSSGEYVFYVPYKGVDDLTKQVEDIIYEIASDADRRNCFIEADTYCGELDLYW